MDTYKRENKQGNTQEYNQIRPPKKTFLTKKGFTWRPVPTIFSTTLCFLILGIIFVIIGAVLLYMTSKIKDFVVRYDDVKQCVEAMNTTNKTCAIDITLQDTFEPPVMVYYQLENFFQDHRRYIKSKSVDQLKGQELSISGISLDCDPIITIGDLGFNKTIGGLELNDTAIASPCGLIARSLFNDTYNLTDNGTFLSINESNITWDSDKLYSRYKRSKNANNTQWTDVENEHFMVWMRPAGLPDFRKLWGRINTTLNPGTYQLIINNNYPVASFNGKKSFVLSTVNIFGGRNNFLGISYLVVGFICLIMALLFWVGHKNYNSDKKLN
jgi:hypothetical protein